MDYDSSTKFISSLAKFLQSLCNGYVEFDNGVQVIGHLYLNVDTGKTIDYVLNEKVCKTDENSVTFISNSFHAQPAEKPKPPGKNREADKNDLKPEVEAGSQPELRGSNAGALSSSRSQNSNSLHAGAKRPLSPSKPESGKSGHGSPSNKRSRPAADSNNTTHSGSQNMESSSKEAVYQHSLSHETSSFNESYQQNFFTGDENSVGDGQEQRDIKPTFDTDITFIKEEYAPSSLHSENQAMQDDGMQGDSSSGYPHSYPNQQFHPGGYSDEGNFNPNQRSAFNPAGFSSGNSQMDGGDVSNDPSEPLNLNLGSGRNSSDHLGTDVGLRGGKGFEPLGDGDHGGSMNDMNRILSHWPHRRLSYPPTPRSGSACLEDWKSPDSNPLAPVPPPTSNCRMYRDMYGNPMFATCSKCGGNYTNPNVCVSHETKCTGTNRLMCHICKRVYSQMCALKEHLRGKHGLGEMLKCKLCDRSFKYKPQLYDHACAGLKKDISARSPSIPQ